MISHLNLGECCKIISGSTPDTSNPEYWGGDIVWITPKDLSETADNIITNSSKKITKKGYDSCSTQILPKGTVLLSSRAPIGLVAIAGKELCTNQGFKSLIPDTSLVLSKYLMYWLRYKKEFLNSLGNGATFKEISKKTVENIKVSLPSIEEQKRIASILDKANELKEKRKKAIEKLDELVQSVFIDMFGDPVENPKNWEIVTFDKLMTEIYYGTSKTPEYLDQGIAFVRATNVKNGKIVHNDMKFMGQSFADSIPHCKLKKGDMIIVRSGVNTGDCAIFRDEYPQAYAAYDLIIKLPSQISEFYNFLFNTDYKERVIKPLTRRAGQPHINSEQIKSLLVIKPPTVLIDKFTSYLIKSFEINKKNDKSLCDIESLQASLHNIFFSTI